MFSDLKERDLLFNAQRDGERERERERSSKGRQLYNDFEFVVKRSDSSYAVFYYPSKGRCDVVSVVGRYDVVLQVEQKEISGGRTIRTAGLPGACNLLCSAGEILVTGKLLFISRFQFKHETSSSSHCDNFRSVPTFLQ